MTQPTTPPPLTEEEIARLKYEYREPSPYNDETNIIFPGADKTIRRLIADLEAAQAEIERLEGEREWRPTHRSRIHHHRLVKVLREEAGGVSFEETCSRNYAKQLFFELFEPLPTDTVEGETA